MERVRNPSGSRLEPIAFFGLAKGGTSLNPSGPIQSDSTSLKKPGRLLRKIPRPLPIPVGTRPESVWNPSGTDCLFMAALVADPVGSRPDPVWNR